MPEASRAPAGSLSFRPGAWSIVTKAPDWDPAVVRARLDDLIETFWRPPFVYIRSAGGIGRKEALRAAERYLAGFADSPVHLMTPDMRSRFRTFTRTSVRIFVATGRHQATDDAAPIRRLDPPPSGGEITHELEAAVDADEAFDREWVRSLFDKSVLLLRGKLAATGEKIFARVLTEYDLQPLSDAPVSLSNIAQNIGITRVDARVSLSYARTLLRRILLGLINDTLSNPEDMEDEVAHLVEVSRGDGPPWALLRRILPADDDFMLLQLVLESGRLNSHQMRDLGQLMELSGTDIGKRLTEMGTLDPSQLEPLLVQKESRINAILQSKVTRSEQGSGPADGDEMPEEIEELMSHSANFLGKFLKIEPVSEEKDERRWKCLDLQTKKYVHVLFLEEGDVDEAISRDLVMSQQIQHPNIVPLLDFGTVGAQSYAATPVIGGEILQGRRISERRALELMYEVARAVEDAHQRGLTHGDLKPEHIVLDADGRVKILGFGLAKLYRKRHVKEEDERAYEGNGEEKGPSGVSAIDVQCDIVAIGATLYELLAGTSPFGTRHPYEWLRAPGELKSLRTHNSEVGFPTDQLVGRILRPTGPRHFESAGELAFAIRRLLKGETIELPGKKAAVPTVEATARWIRIGLVGALVAMLVLLAFALGRGMSAQTGLSGHLRAGNAAYHEGDYGEALRHFHAALAIDPENGDAAVGVKACRQKLSE